jgi:purine-binding chemotaxis protein CheW
MAKPPKKDYNKLVTDLFEDQLNPPIDRMLGTRMETDNPEAQVVEVDRSEPEGGADLPVSQPDPIAAVEDAVEDLQVSENAFLDLLFTNLDDQEEDLELTRFLNEISDEASVVLKVPEETAISVQATADNPPETPADQPELVVPGLPQAAEVNLEAVAMAKHDQAVEIPPALSEEAAVPSAQAGAEAEIPEASVDHSESVPGKVVTSWDGLGDLMGDLSLPLVPIFLQYRSGQPASGLPEGLPPETVPELSIDEPVEPTLSLLSETDYTEIPAVEPDLAVVNPNLLVGEEPDEVEAQPVLTGEIFVEVKTAPDPDEEVEPLWTAAVGQPIGLDGAESERETASVPPLEMVETGPFLAAEEPLSEAEVCADPGIVIEAVVETPPAAVDEPAIELVVDAVPAADLLNLLEAAAEPIQEPDLGAESAPSAPLETQPEPEQPVEPEPTADQAASLIVGGIPNMEGDYLGEIVRQIEEENTGSDLVSEVFGFTPQSAAEAGTLKRYVVFSIGATEYAVPIINLSEVARPLDVTPVPNMPDWVSGVANLRGDIISIVDLRIFLGQAAAELQASNRMLVVHAQKEDLVMGLTVDRVGGIFDLPEEQIRSPSAPIEDKVSGYMRGVSDFGDRLFVVLDLNHLLLSPEIQQFQ